MNIQLEKAIIIDQLKHITDADLIRELQSLLTKGLKKDEQSFSDRNKEMIRKKEILSVTYPVNSFLG